MKKFIFGVMLLVSMLGIVGCSMDSSDSTSYPVPETSTEEEIVYTIKNESGVDVILYYESNSNTDTECINFTAANRKQYTYETCKKIPLKDGESCEINKSDCRTTKIYGVDAIRFVVYDTANDIWERSNRGVDEFDEKRNFKISQGLMI